MSSVGVATGKPPSSVPEVFDRLAHEHGAGLAVCGGCGDGGIACLTWAELQDASTLFAARLAVVISSPEHVAPELVGVLAKRSPLWLAATVGVMRCGIPFVWMGAGELPPKSQHVEAARNADIVQSLRPGLVILGGGLPESVVPDWNSLPGYQPRFLNLVVDTSPSASARPRPHILRSGSSLSTPLGSETMCYMMTGGTTGASKCVKVTHAMTLHEVQSYPGVAPTLGHKDRILQHTAVLWGASAIGQINIALAFGATICISSAVDQESIIAHGATILGVVPSSLTGLDPKTVPDVRCAFTWGESLSRVTADKWRESRVNLYELLISTEYWLSFVGEGDTSVTGRPVYRIVSGTDVAVLPEGAAFPTYEAGIVGELCIRGPMVSPGYVALTRDSDVISTIQAIDAGPPFFHTKDLVRLVDRSSGSGASGIEFCGRSDQLVKVAGQFIDLAAAESQLSLALNSNTTVTSGGPMYEVSVVPTPAAVNSAIASPPAHTFVAVKNGSDLNSAKVTAALGCIRRAMPRGSSLHLVDMPLPKDAVTGKVDRKALLAAIVGKEPTLSAKPALKERLKLYPLILLAVVFAGSIDVPILLARLFKRSSSRTARRAFLIQTLLHLCSLPYLWLSFLHIPKPVSRKITNNVPFGRLGTLVMLHHAARRASWNYRSPLGQLPRASLALGGCVGAILAKTRGSLRPWWLAFWFAIPDILNEECSFWLSTKAWTWYVKHIWQSLLEVPDTTLPFAAWVIELVSSVPRVCSTCINMVVGSKPPYQLPPALIEKCVPEAPLRPYQPWPDQSTNGVVQMLAKHASVTADACKNPTTLAARLQSATTAPASPSPTSVETMHPPQQQSPPLEGVDPTHDALTPTPSRPDANGGKPAGSWHCCECRCDLPWTSDWRCEEGRYFCKPCYKELDSKWWESQTKDIIDVRSLALSDSCETTGGGGGGGADSTRNDDVFAKASGSLGARLLQLLSPHLGGGIPYTNDSIAGIDSLAVMSICNSMRLAAPEVVIRAQDVFNCRNVGELLAFVEEAQQKKSVEVKAEFGKVPALVGSRAVSSTSPRPFSSEPRAVWFAPSQYTGTCKWMYGCKGQLNEQDFRIAAARLIARHEALHAHLCDGDSAMEVLRFLKDFLSFHHELWPAVEAAAAGLPPRVRGVATSAVRKLWGSVGWALAKSWPRSVGKEITQDFLDERIRVIHCRTWKDVDEASRDLRDDFTPPFLVALYLLKPDGDGKQRARREEDPSTWGAPTSFINFVVSHSFSDGYTGVPLIQDISSLYAKAAAESHRGSLDVTATVAPLEHGASFKELEHRFCASLQGRPAWSVPQQLSLRGSGFDGPWEPKRQPWQYNHEVLLERNSVLLLRQSAKRYGVPFDILLLSTVLSATFRALASLQSDREAGSRGAASYKVPAVSSEPVSLPLTLYAPMRDGENNDSMVGLFSDWRDVTIPCGSNATVLGLCLDVADTIRHRRWKVFDAIQNSERLLVNILPLDEQVRGSLEFRQTRAHEYAGRRSSPCRERKAWKGHGRPMRLTLEQESHDAWWISVDLNSDRFPTGWCRGFVRHLQRSLEDLDQRPLTRLIPLPVEKPAWTADKKDIEKAQVVD